MIDMDFILSGKAIFTVSGKAQHYTFKVQQAKQSPKEKAMGVRPAYFVKLLTGPDNKSDYTYMGILRLNGIPQVAMTAKSNYTKDSLPVQVFDWAMKILNTPSKLPPGYNIQHLGMCGHCLKDLTDPISILTGIGPICRKKLLRLARTK